MCDARTSNNESSAHKKASGATVSMQAVMIGVLLLAEAVNGLSLAGGRIASVRSTTSVVPALQAPASSRITMAAQMEDDEISDVETGVRWVGVQGFVDLSVVAIFASQKGVSLMEIFAAPPPELKYIIVMPAFCVFCQFARRFGSADYEIKNFESDPIVKILGGPKKVRRLRDQMQDGLTVR